MRHRRLWAGLTATVVGAATLTLLGAAPVAAALPSQCTTSGGVNVTCTFAGGLGSTGTYSLPIPDGVASVHLHVVGTAGQASNAEPGTTQGNGAPGGRPAVIDADVAASTGDELEVDFLDNGGIGHFAGGDDTAGPYLPASGSGGGSAVVRRSAGPLIAEAGGGGGGGLVSTQNPVTGSIGGAAGSAGQIGAFSGNSVVPAQGGMPGAANDGPGGAGATVDAGSTDVQVFATGSAASNGQGGNGAPGEFPGGGGGGGTRAGGGGGAGGTGIAGSADGAGGGGGSSTLPAGGTLGISQAESSLVRITFTLDVHASYSPTSIDFGNVTVGTIGAPHDVTLTNTGTAPLPVSLASVSGSGFTITSQCNNVVLDVGASCQVAVSFSPSSGGHATGQMSIQDGSPTSPHNVSLEGTGTVAVPVAAPTAVDFGSSQVGAPRLSRTVTLSNTGAGDLVVTAVTLSGDADFALGPNGCASAVVTPTQSCTVTVEFSPSERANRSASLRFTHNGAGGSTTVPLTGAGITEADLKIRGTGTLYTGRDHTVTGVVGTSGNVKKYSLQVLNEDTTARAFQIAIGDTDGSAKVEIWSNTTKVLPYGSRVFTTGTIQPGKTATYSLRVTPFGTAGSTSHVDVSLATDFGAPIESVSTETYIAAPTNGTTSYELFAKQGSQLFVGGPTDGQIATGPALNVGGSAAYVLRLKNNAAAGSQIGLRLTDVDGCGGSYTVTVTDGVRAVTGDAYAGNYLSPSLGRGAHRDVRVVIRRTSAGCPSRLIKVQSLDHGVVVRTSYLLANAAYNAATD